MTLLSCTEVPAPTVIRDASPRSTAPNQMLARSPTWTSPISTAVGASHTSAPIVGRTPSSSTIVAMAGAYDAGASRNVLIIDSSQSVRSITPLPGGMKCVVPGRIASWDAGRPERSPIAPPPSSR